MLNISFLACAKVEYMGPDTFSRGQDVIPWDLLAEIDFFVLSYSLTLS